MKANKWFNNFTPQQLAVLTAISCTIGVLLVLLILPYFIKVQYGLTFILIFLALVFGISYGVILFILIKFLYRRIKVIYKLINNSRISDKKIEELINVREKVFDKVEADIKDWILSRDNELKDLETLENYRRNYIGNVSHELKTPIFNVQGYIHTLLDGALYDEEINHSYLLKAARNISRLQTIVEDLDSISKLESGELILDLQVLDIKKLVEEVFEELELQAQSKNIQLGLKDGARTSYQVIADKESIRQVLINLIMNSIKYGKMGGRTKVGFYDIDNNVLVEVSDDGIGIEEHHLKHVFDRFYRVDKSRSRNVGGSGLGLSIVKHIIEAHKQTINVRSNVGVGATFGFTLKKK